MTGHPGDGHAAILNALAAAYDRYGWGDEALAGYLLALSDLPVSLLRRAAAALLRSHTGKMPTPAELRRAALAVVAGDGPPDVDRAWAELLERLGTHGRLRTPEWSHPLIGEAVQSLGGWGRVCATDDDMTGLRIRFHRAYTTYATRAEQWALTSPGLNEAAALLAGATRLPALGRGDAE